LKALVGLGNPGAQYADTRHNLGFMVADALAAASSRVVWSSEGAALLGRMRLGGGELLLAKPQTYMNGSGRAVRQLVRRYQLVDDDLMVAHDDLDLPLGSVRVKRGGGHGGHRGIESILQQGEAGEFVRIRLGIRPEQGRGDAADFVLSGFDESEVEQAESMVQRAVEAVRSILSRGLARTMTEVNARTE
jgi:PTH1 family peptidyl-tRNA hydrolase